MRLPVEAFRHRYRQAAYLALFLLPPLHMAVAGWTGFSPWKFLGWGMYATPHPNMRRVVAIAPGPGCGSSRAVPPVLLRTRPLAVAGTIEHLVWVSNAAVEAPAPPLLQGDPRDLAWKAMCFQVLASTGALESLLGALGTSSPRMVALLDERLDLESGLHYADLELFRHEDGRFRSLGRFSGKELTPLSRIAAQFRCP